MQYILISLQCYTHVFICIYLQLNEKYFYNAVNRNSYKKGALVIHENTFINQLK